MGVGVILLYSLLAVELPPGSSVQYAFGGMYALDGLALFFKRFFLLAALIVLLMSVEFADRIAAGIAEFYALILFALAGMLFASSANDFACCLSRWNSSPSRSMCSPVSSARKWRRWRPG